MTINVVKASYELSQGITPGFVFINTSDDALADVLVTGYLNGQEAALSGIIGSPIPLTNLMHALVNTTDSGVAHLQIEIDGEDISLVAPTSV